MKKKIGNDRLDKFFLAITKYGTILQIILSISAIIISVLLGMLYEEMLLTWSITLLCLIALDLSMIGFVIIHDKIIIDNENDFYFFTDNDIRPFMKKAKKNIYIVAVTGVNLHSFGKTLEACIDKGVHINFLLCTAPKIDEMCEFSLNPAQTNAAIRDNNSPNARIRALLANKPLMEAYESGLIKVKLIDSFLSTSFIGIDLKEENGKIQCMFYQYKTDSPYCPVIMFDKQMEFGRINQNKGLKSLGVELRSNIGSEDSNNIIPAKNWYEYYENIILNMWEEDSNQELKA